MKTISPPYTVIKASAVLGEGPAWCARSQSLLWIDGHQPQYFRWRWGQDQVEVWPLQRPPAALVAIHDGRWLMAFRARLAILSSPGADIQALDHLDLPIGEGRFNDAKADRRGRLWIGTIDRALTRRVGHLWRLDDSGLQAMASGFALSNGLAWSPDGRTLYFSESFDKLVHRYTFDEDTGSLGHAGVLVNLKGEAGKPDGLTVDQEGGVWCVMFGGGCIHRYLPDGTLDQVVHLPVSNPTSCIFGGPNYRTLFVTTASYGLAEAARAAEPFAGSVLAIPMDVAGLAEPALSLDWLAQPQGVSHV